MKQCRCCGEFKPESEFWHDRRSKDRLSCYCGACRKMNLQGMSIGDIRRLMGTEKKDPLGGWKISILNHVKAEEKRFNLIECGGKQKVLATNDKKLFERRLLEILNNF
nr:MAG TPA: Stc1 domain [Caudoviricetes sp.]